MILASGLLLVLAGCATNPDKTPEALAMQEALVEKALSDLAQAPFNQPKLVSEFPRVEARVKVSDQRVEAMPLEQPDGRSFPARMGRAIGYPATLELRNADSVAVEITDLKIRRRTPRLIGDYEPFLGSDPITLQPGETWRGTFIVSRKQGWFRVGVQATAPPGWTAIPGDGTRNVFFQETTSGSLFASEHSAEITFWNLREDAVAFRYWISTEDTKGIPKAAEDEGVIELGAGEALKIEPTISDADWKLVTAPIQQEGDVE